VLVKIQGKVLVFDFGAGTMRRLLESNTSVFDISYIFFSHIHPDHTGELVSYLFAARNVGGEQRQIPLTVVASKGFSKFYRGLKAVYGRWIELAPGYPRVVELDNEAHDFLQFDQFTVESLPVEHEDHSLAYKITAKDGKSVVYSGDTDFSENLITLSRGTDLLICESSTPDEMKIKGHLTPSLAGEVARRADVGKLVLTHFYPECDGVDIEDECRKTYKGPILLAEDLMEILI